MDRSDKGCYDTRNRIRGVVGGGMTSTLGRAARYVLIPLTFAGLRKDKGRAQQKALARQTDLAPSSEEPARNSGNRLSAPKVAASVAAST